MREQANLIRGPDRLLQSLSQDPLGERPAPRASDTSPSEARRGRQLQNHAEPGEYQDVPIQDSPFRRREHAREIQLQSGPPGSAARANRTALRRLQEEHAIADRNE